MTDRPETLAERVDWLFRTFTKPDGTEYTYQEVEEGTQRLGHRITATGVWKIRHGETVNPGYLALRSLARFFSVPVDVFYEDELSEEQLRRYQLAASLQNPNVEQIALRASRLHEDVQQTLLDMIQHIAVSRDNRNVEKNQTPQSEREDTDGEGA